MLGAAQPTHGRLQLTRLSSFLIVVGFMIPRITALQTVPGSNCTALCAQGSASPTTNGSDIVCNDSDYNNTATGSAFQACVSCELQSRAIDHATGQTDVGWALYNMRYAVDWCIFGFPTANDQVLSNPCIVTCDYVANTLETNIITPNISSPYGYCQGGPAFLSNLSSCAYCESLVPNRFYLSNFLNTLKAACQSQPSSSTAFPISPVQIFTLHPPASYPTTTSTTHGLSHGATIAIGIIVPLVILLLLALFSVYWYRRYKSSNSPSHKYRPQQSLFDERWGDTQITRPSGGTSQYASDYLPPSGSQSYFPAPKGGAQTQYSSVPLETQYPPAKSQHQLSREEERRYSQPHPYHPSGVHDANTKGKSREAGMTVTTPPAQVKKSQKRSFGKTVTGMNLPIGRKPKVTVDTVRVGRERDDYGESPSDLFG